VKTTTNRNLTVSPVKTINGQNSVDFLTAWAKNASLGLIEPNADYNKLFPNAARSVGSDEADRGAFTTNVYPGSDNMTITFANGTSVSGAWGTISTKPLIGVRSGQDFYNLVVAPDDSDDDESDDSPASPATNGTLATLPRLKAPYPAPVVVQKGLGNGGFCTGYFLNKSSIAVLSIPTFDMNGPFGLTFQQFVTDFLKRSKAAGMKKLVIDLQGNGGGVIFEGIDLFKQVSFSLLPSIPWRGN
jgi:hypothetical protein